MRKQKKRNLEPETKSKIQEYYQTNKTKINKRNKKYYRVNTFRIQQQDSPHIS